jgi:hypothetical protein
MKITLSNSVLEALVAEGYTYVLSKTYEVNHPDFSYSIVLTPLKHEPDFTSYQKGYDLYFNINRERSRMAKGINGARIFVYLNGYELTAIKNQLLKIDSHRRFEKAA